MSTNEQKYVEESGHTGKRRVLSTPALIAILLLASLWGLQYTMFPRSSYYRNLVLNANRVELRAFVENNEEGGKDVAVLRDPADIELLAESIKIRGVWLPLDELIGNSYRIRVVKGDEKVDMIIRGGDRIKHGNWFATISPSAMETFVHLVEKAGGTMPSVRELTKNDGQASSNVRSPIEEETGER